MCKDARAELNGMIGGGGLRCDWSRVGGKAESACGGNLNLHADIAPVAVGWGLTVSMYPYPFSGLEVCDYPGWREGVPFWFAPLFNSARAAQPPGLPPPVIPVWHGQDEFPRKKCFCLPNCEASASPRIRK